jgi:dihydrodipicolinate synthase/N-acetylneuraminate lyase
MPLTSETLKGMWAGLPVPWNAQDQIDEAALRENVRRVCRAGAHGVYTHGTTGEFYAQTPEEWRRVVDATIAESKPMGVPCQVGCTALWTAEVIRRVAYSQKAGADAVQLAFPFWLPLTDAQAVRFLQDITTAVPGMPVTIYNTERSKKPLTVDLLKRLLDAQIPIIGCKNVRSREDLQELRKVAPHVKFFGGEDQLAEFWQYGVQGAYSSYIYACPRFMLRYFRLCEEGSPEAGEIAGRLKKFVSEFVVPRFQNGLYDTAFDRLFAAMTGFLTGSLLLSRPPYDSPMQKDVDECRDWLARNLPEFIEEI